MKGLSKGKERRTGGKRSLTYGKGGFEKKTKRKFGETKPPPTKKNRSPSYKKKGGSIHMALRENRQWEGPPGEGGGEKED